MLACLSFYLHKHQAEGDFISSLFSLLRQERFLNVNEAALFESRDSYYCMSYRRLDMVSLVLSGVVTASFYLGQASFLSATDSEKAAELSPGDCVRGWERGYWHTSAFVLDWADRRTLAALIGLLYIPLLLLEPSSARATFSVSSVRFGLPTTSQEGVAEEFFWIRGFPLLSFLCERISQEFKQRVVGKGGLLFYLT